MFSENKGITTTDGSEEQKIQLFHRKFRASERVEHIALFGFIMFDSFKYFISIAHISRYLYYTLRTAVTNVKDFEINKI